MKNNFYEDLSDKIKNKTVTIGVIGLGYVGLPLLHAFHSKGLSVFGFDIDEQKIENIRSGITYLHHLGGGLIRDLSSSNRCTVSADFSRLGEPDVLIVCVPTPLGDHQEPNLSYVLDTADAIGRTLRQGQMVILESTTYPRTTRDEFVPGILDSAARNGSELRAGIDVFFAYSPEREDPGRKDFATSSIPKLVGGLDEGSTALAANLYRLAISDVVETPDAETAESAKLLENIFRSVNIALVNEMKIILDKMDIDVWDVIRAARTKPFGFMPFYPGPGLGGHCIPIDPFYLTWKARELGYTTRFIQLAGEINTSMPGFVVARITRALNDRAKPVHGSRILVVGLAYKPDVDDTRESPAFEIIELLRESGAVVSYHDPQVPKAPRVRRHDLQMASVDVSKDVLAEQDAVVIVTNHSSIDYAVIADHSRLIIDTRNAMADFSSRLGDRLVKA